MFSVSLIYNAYMVVYYYLLYFKVGSTRVPTKCGIYIRISISEYCNILRLRMGTPFCFYFCEQIVDTIYICKKCQLLLLLLDAPAGSDIGSQHIFF